MELTALAFQASVAWNTLHRPIDAEIEWTLTRARRLNRLNGVTGATLLFPKTVVQWIEGEAQGVADTFSCVQRDRRLTDLHVVCSGPSSERLFQASWMYFCDLRSATDLEVSNSLLQVAEQGRIMPLQALRSAMTTIACGLDSSRFTRYALMV